MLLKGGVCPQLTRDGSCDNTTLGGVKVVLQTKPPLLEVWSGSQRETEGDALMISRGGDVDAALVHRRAA